MHSRSTELSSVAWAGVSTPADTSGSISQRSWGPWPAEGGGAGISAVMDPVPGWLTKSWLA